jgi:hypothetical protein
MSGEATTENLSTALARVEAAVSMRLINQKQQLDASQVRETGLSAENQRLRSALEDALGNVDSILSELKGKI